MTVRDNVIELRKIRHADTLVERIIHGAAAEIERLREELTASHESHGNEVGALTERLSLAIHERDEARREVCHLRTFHGSPRDYALERRWDCFEDTIR